MDQSYTVAMLGARMHYAVPRILEQSGRLECLYTDVSAAKGLCSFIRYIPSGVLSGRMKKLKQRVPVGVPSRKITAFSRFGIEYSQSIATSGSREERSRIYLQGGKKFCHLVLEEGFGNAGNVFTYNSAGLEILKSAREKGLRTVMEQTIAPKRIEEELLSEERELFPEWKEGVDKYAAEYSEREAEEWGNSDVILCGSEYVKSGIASCGGPVERCVVVPYGVDSCNDKPESKREGGPLKVLFVGSVGLRKGAQYIADAAKQLGRKVEFRVVGPHKLPERAMRGLSAHVDLIGAVSRLDISSHFRWADVFILPSLCEGSATVIYEALSYGLPVICTENSGSVIRDGVEGFVVPIRDSWIIAEKIELLAKDRDLIGKMGEAAFMRSLDYTLDQYSERLMEALSK